MVEDKKTRRQEDKKTRRQEDYSDEEIERELRGLAS